MVRSGFELPGNNFVGSWESAYVELCFRTHKKEALKKKAGGVTHPRTVVRRYT